MCVNIKAHATLLFLSVALAGCMPLASQHDLSPAVTDDPVGIGKTRFRAGDFGLAEESFRYAVEKRPTDPEAWLGLAAAHDQLGRFDLSDIDYVRLETLLGDSATFLNNRGYSYLLRGDRKRARRDLERALTLDPLNTFIRANVAQLRS